MAESVNKPKYISFRTNNNNNQAFWSQASWGRLKMKPHEQKKTGTKQGRKRRVKKKGDKKLNCKRRKRQ
jgi:hypothetical protein